VPPLPKLRIAALDELARQLRFAPPETLRRQLERAEQLAGEIDPAINYPEEWIVFRITGYRPQESGGTVIVGEALFADVSALVERLSAAARIAAAELAPGGYIDADGLCRRWSVSRKSLDRYRRRGLVAFRVLDAGGRAKLMFPLGAVSRFEERHGDLLRGAGRFSRVSPELESRIYRRAVRYRRALGWTLNQAAQRLAKKHGRGHETMRQILRRHDAAATQPVFTDAGPPGLRERELIERAHFLGIEPGRIAQHLHRSRGSINRVMSDQRAARLRTLIDPEDGRPLLRAHPDLSATEACLEASPVTTGLGSPGETELVGIIAAARAQPAPGAGVERARTIAYLFLVGRAAATISQLPEHGVRPSEVDAIETDLRWAARLKAELVRSQLPLLVRTLESITGRGAEETRPRDFAAIFDDSVRAIAEAIDDFHPAKGGRLAAPAGIALTRVMTRFQRIDAGHVARARATPRLARGVRIDDWTRKVAPWQAYRGRVWLEPPSRVRAGVAAVGDAMGRLLLARFGWSGPPRTHAQLAAMLGKTVMRVAQDERRAVREAVRLAAPAGGSAPDA
jgi:RNA polymerase primary sigma factor